jgi:hypothetical protein
MRAGRRQEAAEQPVADLDRLDAFWRSWHGISRRLAKNIPTL